MKFREHRGGLAESMATLVDLPDREALIRHIQKLCASWLQDYDFSRGVAVKPYLMEPDKRIGWAQTYIVLLEGLGPIGFTDSPIKNDTRKASSTTSE